MKSLMFSLLCLVISSTVFANANKVLPLTEALRKRLVTIEATSNGGYMGKGLSLTVHNCRATDLYVTIDNAMIFTPNAGDYQHLVVISDDMLHLKPRERTTAVVQTFCGKSHAGSPREGLVYNFWKKGDETMVQVANFIKANKLYNYIGQSAIWALTDNHSLHSIYSHSQYDVSKRLVNMMAGMLKKKAPEFFVKHPAADTSTRLAVFNPRIEQYVVELEWCEPIQRNMHVTVYKENGEVYRVIDEETATGQTHKITVKLDPKKDPEGTYYVELWDDDNRTYKRVEVPVEKQDV